MNIFMNAPFFGNTKRLQFVGVMDGYVWWGIIIFVDFGIFISQTLLRTKYDNYTFFYLSWPWSEKYIIHKVREITSVF